MALDTFALQLEAFVKKAGENAGAVVRKASLDVSRSVVMMTPVGNPTLWKSKPPAGYVGGRLRANWNASIGGPDLRTTTAVDATGTATIDRMGAVLAQADGQQDIYIMNSLPYAPVIEYEGHSKQAPAGMVRITVAQWQGFVDRAAAEVQQ